MHTYALLKGIDDLKTKEEKIDALRSKRHPTTDLLFKMTFDPAIEFDLPDSAPPFVPSKWDEAGNFHQEIKRAQRVFIKGATPGLSKVKIEGLFISTLEYVDKEDATLLIGMIAKKLPFKSITKKLVEEALPELFV
jgi:hypothetical protein